MAEPANSDFRHERAIVSLRLKAIQRHGHSEMASGVRPSRLRAGPRNCLVEPSRSATSPDQSSVERRDDLLEDPARGPACGDVEQGSIECMADRAAGRRIASVEFDAIRTKAEVTDKDREEWCERCCSPLDRDDPRIMIAPGPTQANDRRLAEGRAAIGTHPQLEVAGKAADIGRILRDSLAQPVGIFAPEDFGDAPEIGLSRHGDVELDRTGDLVGPGSCRLRHASISDG
jgi:hypothetical protein